MKAKLFNRPISLVTLFGKSVRVTPGVLSLFSNVLYENNLNIYAISSGEESLTFLVDYVDENRAFEVIKNAVQEGPSAFDELVIRSNKSLINIDVSDVADSPGIVSLLVAGISDSKINILEMFSSFGSLSIVINPEDKETAFNLIIDAIQKKLE
jgi:aspartate kinase